MVSAEDSSSIYALNVIKELKLLRDDFSFFGTGSPFLENEMELLYTSSDLSFVGFEEPKKLFRILRIYRHLKELVRKSDGLILFDYPGMNLRLASYAKENNKPVCYYCAPQVWAWWTKRVIKMKSIIDRLVVLFPFEEKFFRSFGVEARFFGHPLTIILKDFISRDKEDFILLLPGSRINEVKSLTSVMVETSRLIRERYRNNFRFFLVKAKSVSDEFFETIPSWIEIVPFEKRYEYMAKAKFAFSASGTATLELALLGVFTFVVYKVKNWVYWLAKRLVKVRNISIVNILSDSQVFPEYLQDRVHPDIIFEDFIRRYDSGCLEFMEKFSREIFDKLYREDHFKRVGEYFNEVLS